MAESFNLDESTRPPTFVQIREPAGPAIGRRMLFIGGVAIALAAAFGWAAWHPTGDQVAPVAMQAPPAVTGPLAPQPDPAKLESMREAGRSLGRPTAAADLADIVRTVAV